MSNMTDRIFLGAMVAIVVAMFVVTLPWRHTWKKASQFGIEL
jgi:hypothetical protein